MRRTMRTFVPVAQREIHKMQEQVRNKLRQPPSGLKEGRLLISPLIASRRPPQTRKRRPLPAPSGEVDLTSNLSKRMRRPARTRKQVIRFSPSVY